jgi:anti-sigma B factor antagonist
VTGAASRSLDEPGHAAELVSIETVRLDERRAHIKVRGDLDVSTAAALWAVLQSHLSAGRRFLRLDLSAVNFVDAAAVTAIVEVHHEALYRRGTLVLAGVNAVVARMLSLTGVHEKLFIAGPRSDADLPEPALG